MRIDDLNEDVEIPEVTSTKYENIYKVGDWSFDIRDDPDPEETLKSIGAWIAWYEFLVARNNQ